MFLHPFNQARKAVTRKFKRLVRQTSGKAPLRLMIVVPFIIQITGAVGIVVFLSFRNGVVAITTVVDKLQNQITTQVNSDLENYLAIPKQINQTSGELVQSGVLSIQDLPPWRQFLWRQVQLYPSVSTIIIGNNQGEQIHAANQENGGIRLGGANATTGFDLYSYQVDAQGNPIGQPNITQNYDPRTRPFYLEAVQAKKPVWSEIYPNLVNNLPQISASLPVYDANQQLLGVASTTLSIARVDDF
ncbi:MAG: hypothetical protein HC916_01285 [Coleofasciculaceae cyanobacterium SM2_1_6]|nr:hypothetical protein [Coleofasciculaceae cyanobacterium SM2_1_6]